MFTLSEIVDIIVMTFFLGWLFSDAFRRPTEKRDIVDYYNFNFQGIKWRDIQFSAMIVAPGIVLHELAHKFVAMAFGAQAQFFAFYRMSSTLYMGLLAIVMKLANVGFLFIVPAFVMHTPTGHFASAMIALAGPMVHVILWAGACLMLRSKKISRKKIYILSLTKKINMFLFIFNMLPLPGFDGWQVYTELIAAVAG